MNALNWLGESAARACAGACLLLAAQGVMAQAGWKPALSWTARSMGSTRN